jgi:hypothetical protein
LPLSSGGFYFLGASECDLGQSASPTLPGNLFEASVEADKPAAGMFAAKVVVKT